MSTCYFCSQMSVVREYHTEVQDVQQFHLPLSQCMWSNTPVTSWHVLHRPAQSSSLEKNSNKKPKISHNGEQLRNRIGWGGRGEGGGQELFPRVSHEGMQALHVGSPMAVQAGHGNLDPGQNDARISPRLCLSKVNADLYDVNHYIPHIIFIRKCTLGTDSLKRRQYL